MQAEGLFNDATSLVLFQIAVTAAVAGTTAHSTVAGLLLHGAGQFVVLAVGGAAIGGAVAAGIIAVRRHITDPVLETVLALVTPYAACVLGEALHVSPVMAVIVAGLVIGARRARITTAQTRLQLHSVYQTIIFLLESVVFSLIGLQVPTLIRALSHREAWPLEVLAVAGTLIAARILWVFPLSAVVQPRSGIRRLSWPVPAVVSWAGTRGVVPLAAGPVHSPDLSDRGAAARARPHPGARHRGHRGVADRARAHPGAPCPAGQDRPARRGPP